MSDESEGCFVGWIDLDTPPPGAFAPPTGGPTNRVPPAQNAL